MILAAHDLTITAGGRTLIDRANFALRPGECWALLGPNGVGKTLLIATLAGLRAPAAGQVTLDDRPIRAWPRALLARTLGLLAQDESADFWGTTADYVALGRYPHGDIEASGEPVARVLAQTDLAGLATARYRHLSGGERQRARVAQLLVQAPGLYLLDEPLNHLDPRHRAALLALIGAQQRAGHTILATLHSPAAARLACSHALLVYDHGHITQGPSAELLTDDTLRKLYGLDAHADLRLV